MQMPTATGIRVRSRTDALKLIYGAVIGVLPMTVRRLNEDERKALRPGDVYVWEQNANINGESIERFTEGRKWTQSRVREEFLFYHERQPPVPDGQQILDWDPMVRQAYSVEVNHPTRGRRKMSLTSYYSQRTADTLGAVDSMPAIQGLVVPDGIFEINRSTKQSRNRATSGAGGGRSRARSASISGGCATDAHRRERPPRTYAPFPSSLPSSYYPLSPPLGAHGGHVPLGPLKENRVPLPKIDVDPALYSMDAMSEPSPTYARPSHSLVATSDERYPEYDRVDPNARSVYVQGGQGMLPGLMHHTLSPHAPSSSGLSSPTHSQASSTGAYCATAPSSYDSHPSVVTRHLPLPHGITGSAYTYDPFSESPSDESDVASPTGAHPPRPDGTSVVGADHAGMQANRAPWTWEGHPSSSHLASRRGSIASVTESVSTPTRSLSCDSSTPSVELGSARDRTLSSPEREQPGVDADIVVPCRSLAPLKRTHPYRRDPVDDKTLRLLNLRRA